MAADPLLIKQVLSVREPRNVRDSPIVTAVILNDVAYISLLTPYLNEEKNPEAINARRILCLYGSEGVDSLLQALETSNANGRKEGLEVMAAMLAGEHPALVREKIRGVMPLLSPIFDDKNPLPDTLPVYIERDFRGRVCDQVYLVVAHLLQPGFDQSYFRGLEAPQRDVEISKFRNRNFGMNIS